MVEIYLLEQLDAFARCGTLSKAAEELHISQPALSRSMQRLEDETGVKLFDRNKNRISLNDNGKLAAEYAAEILAKDQEMIEKIKAYDLASRSIILGSDAPGPIMKYEPLLKKFYPGTEVSSKMETDEKLLEELRGGTIHLAVLDHEVGDGDLYCREACREQLYLSCMPGSAEANFAKEGIHFEDMDGQSFLQLRDVGVWTDTARKMMPHTHLLLQEEMSALGELVTNSGLPAFATNITLNMHKDENRVFIPFLDPEATKTFYACCIAEDRNKYRKFFDYLSNDK